MDAPVMTYQPKSDFLRVMIERGFLADCTDMQGFDDALMSGRRAGLYRLRRHGQVAACRQPDPDHDAALAAEDGPQADHPDGWRHDEGRRSRPSADERPLLTAAEIDENIAGIKTVFAKYLDYGDGPSGALMLNNAEWLDDLNYLDFLRDIGRHFSVNRMLSFESVKSRLDREQSLSFLEFNYMILQAYDFLELNRRYGCRVQMGGSDQWGNIVNGIDLTRRVLDAEIFGLTSPLLTTSDGKKMGKSASGAIWLNAEMLSPTSSGSSGATPPMPMWAGSSSSTPSCRSRNATGSARSKGRRSTRPRSCWPTR
jgi:tyrosyl-tRNA synthetase